MSASTFYRHLQEAKPDEIEALAFITGDTLSPWVKQFLDDSQRPYVEKPILPREIRGLVELLMERKGERRDRPDQLDTAIEQGPERCRPGPCSRPRDDSEGGALPASSRRC